MSLDNPLAEREMPRLVEIRRCPTYARAAEKALVLSAMGIQCHVVPDTETVGLYVPAEAAGQADHHLSAYEAENAHRHQPHKRFQPFSAGVDAALVYCALLLFFFAADGRDAFAIDWVTAGAAQADRILDGELWRTLTALTLHGDFAHILGNLGFGVIAGALAAQLVGPGVAWLAILGAGGLGNFLTAIFQAPDHTSIGASTAVFGAVGILSGHAQQMRTGRYQPGLRRWSPVAAGIMLLVFLGLGGERTDIWAHIAGFAVGTVAGLGLAQISRRSLANERLQWTCGGVAAALVLLAWLAAVASA